MFLKEGEVRGVGQNTTKKTYILDTRRESHMLNKNLGKKNPPPPLPVALHRQKHNGLP